MKKIFLIAIVSFGFTNLLYGQDTLAANIRKLAHLKSRCEIYEGNPLTANLDSISSIGDSICYQYLTHIHKLKKSQKIYLAYINKALKNKSVLLTKETNLYKKPPILTYQMDPNQYFIKTIDLYRVLKYSLFERNDKKLPER